jgi:protein arginine N-methyltransferase 1
VYNILDYGDMISDRVRLHAFMEALRRNVMPGSTVLDLGTGPGIMALLACRFGARKVYAIESNPVVNVARDIAVTNGFDGQIEFIEGLSTEVSLPERVDAIVSDAGGVLPWYQQHLRSVADARRRFLAPGGVMIPKKHVVWFGVVESEAAYFEHSQPWETGHGFEMHAARDLATNTWKKVRLLPKELLAPPQYAAALDFMTVEETDSKADLTFAVTRPGVGHGILGWFDCVLTDEISFSNAPGCHRNVYGQAFFPWTRPVNLEMRDVVNVNLRCNMAADDYIFRWNTEVLGRGKNAEVKASFDQSDFRSFPISPASLRKGAETYVPRTNGDASIDSFILGSMDGKASVGEIAVRLSKCFPGHFRAPSEALDRVARVSRIYSE